LSQLSQGGTPETGKGQIPPKTCITPVQVPLQPSVPDSNLAAIRAGNKTPGAVATATRLGATATYQQLDRMAEAGLVKLARDGGYFVFGLNSAGEGEIS